ncbi:lytic transglycosylase [Rahnella sp. SAP-1]|uniref:Lytic transglycosylase n=1 Tax=Rouxiella aceris TaxID=2703884 RepID=A0A848MGQ9_9GAMM|nr:lytic transglycosylase [Rouxiella aceris]NMP26845.1 lytic transglycosylase [Rouxiella aceris]
MRPAKAFHLDMKDLKSGAIDLYDIALMNDYLDMEAENEAKIERWRAENERGDD